MNPEPMHPDQIQLTEDTVRALVDRQFPAWSELPISEVRPAGTVHAIFRIGDRLAARFPLRPADAGAARRLQAAEAEAAGRLIGHTRFPTPEPVASGEPGEGYPMPWSVQTWLPGVTAEVADPGGSTAFAADLAEFVRDVRRLGTGGRTFCGPGRGGDLRAHDPWMATCLGHSAGLVDVQRLAALWERLRELPRSAPDVLTHGDLIPGNLLAADGRLAGVLDVGGLGPADPALDLVGGWHVLAAGPRAVFRDTLGCDELEWERGRAWAFEQAMGLVWYYRGTSPAMSALGRRTLQRLLADEPGG